MTVGKSLCEHNCTDLPENGFVCSCFKGFGLVKFHTNDTDQRHLCKDIDECSSIHLNYCPHKCINTKGSYKCECHEGFIDTRGDGSVCEASNANETAVFISYDEDIRQLRKQGFSNIYNSLIEHERLTQSLDINAMERHLYWVDNDNTIKRSFIPISKVALGYSQSIFSESEAIITALTVDWKAKNLYFADARRESLRVTKLDGRYPKTITTQNARFVVSLVTNPNLGLIYWIEITPRHLIMVADMSGENVKVLVDTHIDNPTGLAIDYYLEGRLFWCDEKMNTIESVRPDGSDRQKITHNFLVHPFKIDIFESSIFWFTQQDGSIHKMDKFGRGSSMTLVQNLDLAEDIKVFNSLKYTNDVANPCENSNCSHLCLLKPNNDYECACPDNTYFVNNDMRTCDAGKIFF